MENSPETPNPENNKKDVVKTTTERTTSIVQFSGIAFQMLGTIGLGVWAGHKLDEWQQNKTPIWTIVLSLTAIGASLYLFIRQLTK
ncbi:hypothetical protein GCM10027592_33740 [Spirosoma flavus]